MSFSRRALMTMGAAAFFVVGSLEVGAMEPPTAEQVERYRADGSLSVRAEAARRSGNHLKVPGTAMYT